VSDRPLIVRCPCCQAELDIDRRSGDVVRANRKGDTRDKSEKFDDVLGTVHRRGGRGADAFDSVTKKVKGREKQLDQVFQDAFKKVKETDDGKKPFNPLDYD
jgi:hypothetical protein